jgi:curved DNA-binding protein CbpA
MPKDYCFILGVRPNASRDQIEIAYRQRVEGLRPKQFETDKQAFIEIQEA